MDELTREDYISIVHGDAHLGQFVSAPDKSLMTIVDYDTVSEGDPMADIARSLSSLRSWSQQTGIEKETENKLTRSLMQGYRSTRIEQPNPKESEFDYRKIIAYEIRLYLVQAKGFADVRKKIKDNLDDIIAGEGIELSAEKNLYQKISDKDFPIENLKKYGFEDGDLADIQKLVNVIGNIRECIEYLSSVE
ncbi:MAG: hypothetical protein CO141_03300 [Candidatus Moranbacteria bacterium CG_4_9_14_3_um_filter_42_9]|nr:MAG: hypothetical protein CO141_03300 [Candidatus Moranbacteria bacterium CG_4_9_14_3_um_filter_42_9]